MHQSKQKLVARFIFLTYVIFLPLFCLVGAVQLLGFPKWLFHVLFCLSAWSSTFAFAILFKKIYPEKRFLQFVKDQFSQKINYFVLFSALLIQFLIFLLIFILVPYQQNPDEPFNISSWGLFVQLFLVNLFAGPLGEELGWRAFAQIELQKKHSPLIASLIIGFWWGMWHAPIWLTTGFGGIDLLRYICFFILALMAIKIVMTAFYNMNQNLMIPIVMHQFFNFFIGLLNGQMIELLMYSAIFYGLVAIVLIILNPKRVLY